VHSKVGDTRIAISMLVLIPVGILAQDIVARPRPAIPKSDFLIAADKDYAFPSGHAVMVSAGAVENICWWSLSIGCNRRNSFGSWVSLIFIDVERRIESLMIPIVKKILKR
jgi:membrane-associated phospholipid phosphatase